MTGRENTAEEQESFELHRFAQNAAAVHGDSGVCAHIEVAYSDSGSMIKRWAGVRSDCSYPYH